MNEVTGKVFDTRYVSILSLSLTADLIGMSSLLRVTAGQVTARIKLFPDVYYSHKKINNYKINKKEVFSI